MKTITLTQNKIALIDDDDFERVRQFCWSAFWDKWNWYAHARVNGKIIRLHSFILNSPPRQKVDHIDHNGLNNQKANLRFVTSQENVFNKSKSPKSSNPFKGVTWDKVSRRWRARIRVNGKYYSLGRFSNSQDAAKEYDRAAKKLFGSFAYLNFPKDKPEDVHS